eukprot:TRINITY_DN11581_c2_g1_i1.p2 TRINITY_DN11581_c2_g1~~TRINITY_DN11581_c2_g1_i1.p2  ORF type:complete len:115 (-),score=0.13 TRINITY_DN11581_c2_g1_i1:184-528(-)
MKNKGKLGDPLSGGGRGTEVQKKQMARGKGTCLGAYKIAGCLPPPPPTPVHACGSTLSAPPVKVGREEEKQVLFVAVCDLFVVRVKREKGGRQKETSVCVRKKSVPMTHTHIRT